MNRFITHLYHFIALGLMTCLPIHADVIPYVQLRSQGINGAREIVGWQSQINKYDVETWYGSFSITPEYTRSFYANRITEWLFGDALTDVVPHKKHTRSCCHGINIQGSKVVNRDSKALMADNFYLPTDYSSIITFNPVIDNELIDFNIYAGLDQMLEGMFFRIHSPLVHTRWALNMREHVVDPGIQNYDPGYYNNSYTPSFQDPVAYGIPRDELMNNFVEYVCQGKAIEDRDDIHYEGLKNARMNTHSLSKTALAEITAQLGWNFCTGPGYHCGLALRIAAPTGTRPQGTWLFEPIVGNGHHWELGGSLTAHWQSWKNFCQTIEINTYVEINITHLFETRQCRTFDLWCNPLSRYMMALKFTPATKNLQVIRESPYLVYPPTAQYAKECAPLANMSTIPVDVSSAVQGEFVLAFALTHNNYQLDLGYNFWGRTCSDIYRAACCSCQQDFVDNCWGMKGDAFICGFPTVMNGSLVTDVVQPGVPLSATESNATLFYGCNNYPAGIADNGALQPWYTNPGIDNPKMAYSDTYELRTKQIDPANPGAPSFGWNQVNTSVNPVLLTFNDLDINNARSRGISHKAFAHFTYIWKEYVCFTPYIGFGTEIEFAQRDDCNNSPCLTPSKTMNQCTSTSPACYIKDNQCFNDEPCQTIALSQWGIWIKGGISFN